MKLKVKKVSCTGKLPIKAFEHEAGFDVFSNEYRCIPGKETSIINTGIAIEIPVGYFGMIKDRSSMACKNKLHVIAGVIDCSYRGELKIAMFNMSNTDYHIKPGDKVTQIIILPVPEIQVEEVDELSDTNRGTNGFGSTGK